MVGWHADKTLRARVNAQTAQSFDVYAGAKRDRPSRRANPADGAYG